jgi:DNA-binding TFAR19-related protein (PDSD5 family)
MSKKSIILNRNKNLNMIWHKESTLVFKSPEEKIVIGRYEDVFIPFDDIALDLCIFWKFKYDYEKDKTLKDIQTLKLSSDTADEDEENEDDEDDEDDEEEEGDEKNTNSENPILKNTNSEILKRLSDLESYSNNMTEAIENTLNTLKSLSLSITSEIIDIKKKITIQTPESCELLNETISKIQNIMTNYNNNKSN